jgi:RNA polymerase sigma-70 factor (family 1)
MSHYQQLNDFELLARLQNGDIEAFRIIYERYWLRLYNIARNRLNDKLEAEEVVQDIFCNFWRKRSTLLLTKGFDQYFSTAVKFEVINRLARRARTEHYEKEYAAGHKEADNGLLHLLDYKEVKQQLSSAIATLPERCRLVFTLRHEQGYSLRQIAETLDISEKAVSAHLSKARKTLRGALYILWIIYLSSP